MKLLTWCRVVSPGFSDWAGLGLKFVKIFRAGIQNFFIALVATNFSFVTTFVVLTAVTSVSEVIVIFFS